MTEMEPPNQWDILVFAKPLELTVLFVVGEKLSALNLNMNCDCVIGS